MRFSCVSLGFNSLNPEGLVVTGGKPGVESRVEGFVHCFCHIFSGDEIFVFHRVEFLKKYCFGLFLHWFSRGNKLLYFSSYLVDNLIPKSFDLSRCYIFLELAKFSISFGPNNIKHNLPNKSDTKIRHKSSKFLLIFPHNFLPNSQKSLIFLQAKT